MKKKNGAVPLCIQAEAVHSLMPEGEQELVLERIRNGELHLLYVAPERLFYSSALWEVLVEDCQPSHIVFDEAHTIEEQRCVHIAVLRFLWGFENCGQGLPFLSFQDRFALLLAQCPICGKRSLPPKLCVFPPPPMPISLRVCAKSCAWKPRRWSPLRMWTAPILCMA